MAERCQSDTGDRRVSDSHAATFQRAGGRGLRCIVHRRPPTLTIPDKKVAEKPRGTFIFGDRCRGVVTQPRGIKTECRSSARDESGGFPRSLARRCPACRRREPDLGLYVEHGRHASTLLSTIEWMIRGRCRIGENRKAVIVPRAAGNESAAVSPLTGNAGSRMISVPDLE